MIIKRDHIITPGLISYMRYEMSAFRFQVDMLQLHLNQFENRYGHNKNKTTGIMRAMATNKKKLLG